MELCCYYLMDIVENVTIFAEMRNLVTLSLLSAVNHGQNVTTFAEIRNLVTLSLLSAVNHGQNVTIFAEIRNLVTLSLLSAVNRGQNVNKTSKPWILVISCIHPHSGFSLSSPTSNH